jgi:hypothetical protein
MNKTNLGVTHVVSLIACATLAASAARAEPFQTLDRVNVYNQSNVLDMQFNNPARPFDFAALGITPVAGFKSCQLTATQGLYCLDGKQVRYWAKPTQAAGVGTRLLNCNDPALGLDGASAQTCTGMTVGMPGVIWLTGKQAGAAAYRVIRIARRVGTTCPAGQSALADPYCAQVFATSSRPVSDLSAIDGDVGAAFVGPGETGGHGVVGITATTGIALPGGPVGGSTLNKGVIFVPGSSPGTLASIADGNAQWGLRADEQLQGATVLQLPVDEVLQSFVLATTSRGRVLAVNADGQSPAFQVFDIVAERNGSPTFTAVQCKTGAQHYGIRASSKTRSVYLTDRNFCQALALDWAPAVEKPFQLVNVQEAGKDLTFSTTAAYPPNSPTIAPGVIIDLADCAETCIIVYDENGTRAASLSNVRLGSTQSLMTLFQVKGIPDCRWAPGLCSDLPEAVRDTVVLDAAGNYVALDDGRLGTLAANQLFLNVTPLLPLEISGLFDASGAPPAGLPRMLISPQYRGQEQAGFTFESLVGITEPGVVFRDVFDFEFDVLKLAGANLGCGYDYTESLKPNRAWDVTTTVSEKFVTAGGPGQVDDRTNPNRYVDVLLNTGCFNPTRGAGTRWSLYSYNLEVSPDTDAVFARLLAKLYDDLEETRSLLACRSVDSVMPGTGAPLRPSTCNSLAAQWSAGKTLLDQCLASANQPKAASFAADCQAYATQLGVYQATLNAAVRLGPDTANRIGELKARVLTLQHLYADRFLPSVPLDGFSNQ